MSISFVYEDDLEKIRQDQNKGKTVSERRSMMLAYWDRMKPFYPSAKGIETHGKGLYALIDMTDSDYWRYNRDNEARSYIREMTNALNKTAYRKYMNDFRAADQNHRYTHTPESLAVWERLKWNEFHYMRVVDTQVDVDADRLKASHSWFERVTFGTEPIPYTKEELAYRHRPDKNATHREARTVKFQDMIEDCVFDSCKVRYAEFRFVRFVNCQFIQIDFTDVDLAFSAFDNCTFTDCVGLEVINQGEISTAIQQTSLGDKLLYRDKTHSVYERLEDFKLNAKREIDHFQAMIVLLNRYEQRS